MGNTRSTADPMKNDCESQITQEYIEKYTYIGFTKEELKKLELLVTESPKFKRGKEKGKIKRECRTEY